MFLSSFPMLGTPSETPRPQRRHDCLAPNAAIEWQLGRLVVRWFRERQDPDQPTTHRPKAGTRKVFGKGEGGLRRIGARRAAVGGAPETGWQAGRLGRFHRRKYLGN